jgi:hypothetical protein
MIDLHYVPLSEFERVRSLPLPPAARTTLFATLARINALYMIARAGSGHIGTSFSCLDLVAWLHLNEMRPLCPWSRRARAMPFAFETPMPSEPVFVSTSGVATSG